MNRIRKIGNWLWLNKERMVLAVMVCFLIFRVYQVISPPPDDGKDFFRFPDKEPSADVPIPGTPPPPPPPPRADDWSPIWRSSPMIYRAPRIGQSERTSDPAQELQLQLLQIRQTSPGKYMAQIQTAARRGWYEENQAFESYELLSIDADAGTVTVYAEQLTRTVVLSLPQ